MSFVKERTRCPQCGNEAEFEADCRGSQQTTCLICGYYEEDTLKFNADGVYCGSRRVIGKGFGVLGYRYLDDGFFWNHFLRTAREVLDAERWRLRALRSGAIEADTAYLTRWNDDLEQVEVLVGDPWGRSSVG